MPGIIAYPVTATGDRIMRGIAIHFVSRQPSVVSVAVNGRAILHSAGSSFVIATIEDTRIGR